MFYCQRSSEQVPARSLACLPGGCLVLAIAAAGLALPAFIGACLACLCGIAAQGCSGTTLGMRLGAAGWLAGWLTAFR